MLVNDRLDVNIFKFQIARVLENARAARQYGRQVLKYGEEGTTPDRYCFDSLRSFLIINEFPFDW